MSQWYEVQIAQKLDGNDNYGNVTYSVKFVAEADNVLWTVQPKNAPKAGDKVYGMIETRTSKKGNEYRKFKRETPPDGELGQPQTSVKRTTYTEKQLEKQIMIDQGRCYNNAATIVAAFIQNTGKEEIDFATVASMIQDMAEHLYKLPGLGEKSTLTLPPPDDNGPETVLESDEDTVDLNDNQIDMSAIDAMFATPASKNSSDPGQG